MRPRRLLGLLLFCNVSLLSHGFFLTVTTAKHKRPHAYGGNDDSRRSVAARDLSRSSTIISSSNSQENDNDYSALIPRSSSYVPSGLTVDEYRQIKTDEARKLAGLNLGAWGPKFLRSSGGPPAGDWMVMPALWTRGYDSNFVGDGPSLSNNEGRRVTGFRRLRRETIVSCRTNAPAFVLALVAMGTIRSLVRWAVVRVLATSSLLSSASSLKWWRTLAAAIVAAVAAPRIRSSYLESWSRRLLWSQRRLWCASVTFLSVVWMLAARVL